ncbi:MAG: oxidoreductase-like domain-containing protein [Venatoribacter sp.]
MREQPTPPGDNECCESGCCPCVWDTYYDEMNQWRQEKAAQEAAEKEAAEKKTD